MHRGRKCRIIFEQLKSIEEEEHWQREKVKSTTRKLARALFFAVVAIYRIKRSCCHDFDGIFWYRAERDRRVVKKNIYVRNFCPTG